MGQELFAFYSFGLGGFLLSAGGFLLFLGGAQRIDLCHQRVLLSLRLGERRAQVCPFQSQLLGSVVLQISISQSDPRNQYEQNHGEL